jgi:hypothetical protein
VARKRASRQERGYDVEWYRLQQSHLTANPVCVRCGGKAEQADHIKPFKGVDDPLRLDPSNLQSLCIVCHAKKTAEDQRAKSKPGPKSRFATKEEAVQHHREAARDRFAKITRAGQDIGPIPAVTDANWERRLRCIADPELFLRTYFGFAPFFSRPFSPDHLRVIEKGEHCIQLGGNFAYAMPRGHGKTTLCRAFVLRAFLFGLRQFALFVGAADPHARSSLATIKIMLERSPLLAEDFPEVVYPILKLEGSSKRQLGQTCMGEPTDIHWGKDFIQLPTCPPQPTVRKEQGAGYAALAMASGLMGSGITGTNVNGRRPDYLCLDDPQTRQSAKSDSQCAAREEILAAMVTGIASPGVKLAAFMPGTVIRIGDFMDRHLDHEKHPEWAIERCKLLKTMPKNMELWAANKAIRSNYDPYSGPADKQRAANEATEHYIDNQAVMDEGAEASWESRYNLDEVSAIQNAMNLHADNKFAFMAEMQNEPLDAEEGNVEELPKDEAAKRLSGLDRGLVPHGVSKLTAFVDVQGIGLLWYMVCAWRDDFTGWVIDYGAYPNQGRRYFTKATAPTLLVGDEALHSGLTQLTTTILENTFMNKEGVPFKVDLLLVDSGHQAQNIYDLCRQRQEKGFWNRILPSKGSGDKATRPEPFNSARPMEGERRGWQWNLKPAKEKRGVKLLHYEVNSWKSFVKERIAIADGARTSLTFFGDDPTAHQMLLDHLYSEFRSREYGQTTKRTVDEWTVRGNQDNDLWDCLVGCAAAASVQGVALENIHRPMKSAKPQTVSFAEMQRRAKEKVR